MAQFFLNHNQYQKKQSTILSKRKCFERQIRSKDIETKIKQLRMLGNYGPNIKQIVNSLPQSLDDLFQQVISQQQYHEAISKLIIDRMYKIEFSQISSQADTSDVYLLLKQSECISKKQFQKQVYLFSILLQHQGKYSSKIMDRYFKILFSHSQSVNEVNLLFNLINQIVKKPQLNWIPIQQIKQLIHSIQGNNNQNKISISNQQIQTYIYLSNHYYTIVQNTLQIKNRVKFILQLGDACFEFIKPKLYYKLCLYLTYNQTSYINNFSINQTHFLHSNHFQSNQQTLFFHNAMLRKGKIIKNICQQMFFSSNQKLRYICLQILKNIITQVGSLCLWTQQKLNPIQYFEHQIKDQLKSRHLFDAYSEVFLISIIQLPRHQLQKVLENQVDSIGLILYILENSNTHSQNQNDNNQLVEQSLWYFIQNSSLQIRETIANRLIDNQWKKILGQCSQIIRQCEQIVSQKYEA